MPLEDWWSPRRESSGEDGQTMPLWAMEMERRLMRAVWIEADRILDVVRNALEAADARSVIDERGDHWSNR